MRTPGSWWVFQPRGSGRRRLTPLGLAWTVAAYGALGLLTVEALRRLAASGSPAGPVLLVLFASAGFVFVRVMVDGEWLRGSAWLTAIGWTAVGHVLFAAPVCGTLVFGAGLPDVSPGVAPCLPHADFMANVFVFLWVVGGPLSSAVLVAINLYHWSRRDPLHAFRFLID